MTKATRKPLNPQDIGTLVMLVNQDRLSDAERQASCLLRAHPDGGMLWKILGVALLRQGKDALPALERAAQLLPQDAEAQGNLGAALHDRGRWEEALASLQRALALEPNDARALIDAADALRELGRAPEAMPLYRRALALEPRAVDAHTHLGNALRDLGAGREALEHYARALGLDPSRPESHCNLGNLLVELGRSDAAEACFRRALRLQPEHALAHWSLALALRQLHRSAEAVASCQAALAVDPDSDGALSLLGELRADQGRFHEAEELFWRAISHNSHAHAAFVGIAAQRKMTRDDGEWLQGVQALLAARPPLRHEVALQYAMGKYFDDLGQFAEAFGQYRSANELTKRCGSNYHPAKFAQRVDRIIQRIDAAFLERCAAQASPSEVPVFIIGMPRSGTSLVEQILASHPEAYGAGELVFWDAAFAACDRTAPDGAIPAGLLPDLASRYLQRLTAPAAGAARVIDKMPANFLYAGLIHGAFPHAKIIHMKRHPIDTCLSVYFQNFFKMGPYANDLGHLTHYYGQYRRITAHWRGLVPESALLEVPYEALLDDQEGWSRRMLDFIGLPWNPQCLDFERTDRAVITASKWQIRQKIYKTSTERWKNYEEFLGPLRGLLEHHS